MGALVAEMLYVKVVPTFPVAVPAEMTGGGGLTVKLNVAEPVSAPFVALNVTEYVCGAVKLFGKVAVTRPVVLTLNVRPVAEAA